MPIFALTEELVFPSPELAEQGGILAIGGDLRPERLLLAYSHGIFPWYSDDDPILWWSPDPRLVLFPSELKVARSMRPVFNQKKFSYTCDRAFREVMVHCSLMERDGQDGTWINEDMIDAYCELHRLGFAHSVEVWQNNELVGGLYGISLGKCFFGESMFTKVSNASKAGFITLVKALESRGIEIIDCQVFTSHLISLGAREISRKEFLTILNDSLDKPTFRGNWDGLFQVSG